MILIHSYLSFHFFFIFLLIDKTHLILPIQCCTGGDNTCSSKPVYCPSNTCFKLVISEIKEERGCLDDLIKLLNYQNKGSRNSNNQNDLTTGSSEDQCHKLGSYGNGMSLCKCTSNLCNSSSKIIYLTKPVLTLFILFLQYFLHVFLS